MILCGDIFMFVFFLQIGKVIIILKVLSKDDTWFKSKVWKNVGIAVSTHINFNLHDNKCSYLWILYLELN